MDRFRQAERAEEERIDRERRGYFLMIEIDAALGRGDLPAATQAAREAIGISPDDPRLHALLGQCLDGAGDDVGALKAYRRSFELNPGDPTVAVEAGRLLAKGGRYEEAIRILEQAARIDPLMPEPHRLLAAAWERLGRAQDAARERAIWEKLNAR
jgi:Flp pilus assembly protein TadD